MLEDYGTSRMAIPMTRYPTSAATITPSTMLYTALSRR